MHPAFDLGGKAAVIVTMHGKAQVIEPALAALGLRFLPPPAIDTDRFGTFTRDVARFGRQRDALLAKAQAGLDQAPDAEFAVASEGAFGPHPEIPFVPAGHEMVALRSRRSGQAVIGRYLTTATNFMQARASSLAEAHAFAARIGFPDHGIVVMAGQDGPILAKGVTEPAELMATCAARLDSHGSVWLEADMRAHRNPTRMTAIAAATADLAARLHAPCPACAYPGWLPQMLNGRPCAWCAGPTSETWVEQYRCEGCGHGTERRIDPERPGDPGHCVQCNP